MVCGTLNIIFRWRLMMMMMMVILRIREDMTGFLYLGQSLRSTNIGRFEIICITVESNIMG